MSRRFRSPGEAMDAGREPETVGVRRIMLTQPQKRLLQRLGTEGKIRPTDRELQSADTLTDWALVKQTAQHVHITPRGHAYLRSHAR